MEPLIIRYEQKRGHVMVVERNPPVSRDELNETQLQMLKMCDIPGLLPLETEECDGQLSLRYTLSGTRMLSEALRTSNWSMSEMMGALCRLAEVLEECRLYLLDADRIRLHDEFIFVGDEWNDLKFTYIPIDMPTLHRADDLERLIIRWVMKVKEPDGQAMQAILRLVASTGFMPITLSRYARKYLAGTLNERSSISLQTPVPALPSTMPTESNSVHTAKPSRAWELFGPPSGDPHSHSELLGDDSAPRQSRMHMYGTKQAPADTELDAKPMDIGRWRIIVACFGLFLLALGWRFIYMDQPSQQKLLYCLCLTLMIGAGVILLWNGLPQWAKRRHHAQPQVERPQSGDLFDPIGDNEEIDNRELGASPRFPNALTASQRVLSPTGNASTHYPEEKDDSISHSPETSWLPAPIHDQTALLDNCRASPIEACYLVWETKGGASRIPLQGNSLVIGRSAEAAQHVDETVGISRAHAELVRVSEQWKVKDLGSRNGSRLNDKPMAPYELYALQEGDCLKLANSQYRFQQSE
ncbi:DUF6382 domain-containing protein [Cohnella silvisoli]|uniref:DUF6382 domain-containing protein n=1 Tax=Cohnella silvisoli TaxID=2873699 RepID=A0ABV1KXD6_9BACL|nr:DUF6382 domain-containing protein [Cohnella silvisoli]MCD9024031.1 FHA domain-containing protein [Cohnella silvisoli]